MYCILEGAVAARVQCSHEGSRATRVLFTDTSSLLSTGVNANGEREFALWDIRQVLPIRIACHIQFPECEDLLSSFAICRFVE